MKQYPKTLNDPGRSYTWLILIKIEVTIGSKSKAAAGTIGSNNLLIKIDVKNTPKLNIIDIYINNTNLLSWNNPNHPNFESLSIVVPSTK